MIQEAKWLLVAYVANILILVPVCYAMVLGSGVSGVFEGTVADSPGLRLLVASLWCAILAASSAGLFWPAFFAPILLIQVFYKALWLGVFILPLLLSGQPVPLGITTVFAAIVAAYPVLFWLAVKQAGPGT